MRRQSSLRLALLTAALAALLAGCGSLGGIQVFPVSIVNDTSETVVVRDCADYCSSSPIAIELQPGGSTVINRDAGSHKDFSITTPLGAHVGCLDLHYPTPQPGALAPVSQAAPCPGLSRARWETFGLVTLLIALLVVPFVFVRRR